MIGRGGLRKMNDNFEDDDFDGAMATPPKPKRPNRGGAAAEPPPEMIMLNLPMLTKFEHEVRAAADKTMTEDKWGQFEKLCAIKCTKEEILGIFPMPESALNKAILERYGESFSKVKERFAGFGKASLRRAQWKKALIDEDTTMQKWLGQQELGQSAKAENKNETTVNVSVSKDQRDAAVAGLLEDNPDLVIDIPDIDYTELPVERK